MLRDPLGLARRAWFKLVVGPRKYGRSGGYDASSYWDDRFRQYGRSLRAVGHEGLSEEENREAYDRAAAVLLAACRDSGVNLSSARVLEIGCGAGFYTQLMREQGVHDYVGLDITDAFFDELRSAFPDFRFVCQDATTTAIDGSYDLILMIDVVEHIVEEARLAYLLQSVRSALSEGGVFIISGLRERPAKPFFYLRFWTREDIEPYFDGYGTSAAVPSRDGILLAFKKPSQSEDSELAA